MKQLESMYKLYEQMHTDPNMFMGYSLQSYVPEISQIIKDSNIKTVLDYGCGKGLPYKAFNLRQLWSVDDIQLYDPGVPQYQTKPTGLYDMTLCMDVMEHVPEENVDDVLEEIAKYTKKVAVLSISTRPASKTLPDGRNAHLTVKPVKWWKQKLNEMPVYTKAFFPC